MEGRQSVEPDLRCWLQSVTSVTKMRNAVSWLLRCLECNIEKKNGWRREQDSVLSVRFSLFFTRRITHESGRLLYHSFKYIRNENQDTHTHACTHRGRERNKNEITVKYGGISYEKWCGINGYWSGSADTLKSLSPRFEIVTRLKYGGSFGGEENKEKSISARKMG